MKDKGFTRFLELVASVDAEFVDPLINDIELEPTQDDVERLEIVERKKRSRLLEILRSHEANLKIGNRSDLSFIQGIPSNGLLNQPWAELRRGIYKSMWDGNCGDVIGDIWIGKIPAAASHDASDVSQPKASPKAKGTPGRKIEYRRAYDFLKEKIESGKWTYDQTNGPGVCDENGNYMGRSKLPSRLHKELSQKHGKDGYKMPGEKPVVEWVAMIIRDSD